LCLTLDAASIITVRSYILKYYRKHCMFLWILNNNNTIYIALIKSEDTEALGDDGLSLTKQMCL